MITALVVYIWNKAHPGTNWAALVLFFIVIGLAIATDIAIIKILFSLV